MKWMARRLMAAVSPHLIAGYCRRFVGAVGQTLVDGDFSQRRQHMVGFLTARPFRPGGRRLRHPDHLALFFHDLSETSFGVPPNGQSVVLDLSVIRETAGALQQLGQALASGKLGGQWDWWIKTGSASNAVARGRAADFKPARRGGFPGMGGQRKPAVRRSSRRPGPDACVRHDVVLQAFPFGDVLQ